MFAKNRAIAATARSRPHCRRTRLGTGPQPRCCLEFDRHDSIPQNGDPCLGNRGDPQCLRPRRFRRRLRQRRTLLPDHVQRLHDVRIVHPGDRLRLVLRRGDRELCARPRFVRGRQRVHLDVERERVPGRRCQCRPARCRGKCVAGDESSHRGGHAAGRPVRESLGLTGAALLFTSIRRDDLPRARRATDQPASWGTVRLCVPATPAPPVAGLWLAC